MEWFTHCQMMKNKMQDIWQKMSTQERNNFKRMQNASLEERVTSVMNI